MQSLQLTGDELKPLSVNQIKKISTLMDKAVQETNKKLEETEKERNDALREMGNHLHSSCHVSNNEVNFHSTEKFAINCNKQSFFFLYYRTKT